jgi:hypothetical protein
LQIKNQSYFPAFPAVLGNMSISCFFANPDLKRCDRMVVDLQLPMQSVPITTDVVSSNLDQGEVYNIM